MQKLCECGCGEVFEAARRSARFATATCRQRANRAQRREPSKGAAVVAFPRAATSEPQRPASDPRTVRDAIESGDELTTLRVLRLRLAQAVDDPNCPTRDLAALQRSLREIAREIKALELAEQQEAEESVPDDEEFDASAI